MIIGGVVKIAVNWFLVADPGINILGAPIGTLSCYAVMCVMDYIFLCRVMPDRPKLGRILARPGAQLCGHGPHGLGGVRALAALHRRRGTGRLIMALCMCLAIGAAVIVYLVLTVLTRAVTYEDMKLIPKGEKLARLLRIRP